MFDIFEKPPTQLPQEPPPGGPRPIFFAVTTSFLAGILPLVLILIDIVVSLAADPVGGPPVAATLATLAGLVLPEALQPDPAKVEATMRALSPLFGLIIAHQRAGAARPYTLDPRAT